MPFWVSVGANAVWILGVSILLATTSHHEWLASRFGQRRRELLRAKSWQLPTSLGLFLTCIGWSLTQVDRSWERALWLLLAAWCGFRMVRVAVDRDPDEPRSFEGTARRADDRAR